MSTSDVPESDDVVLADPGLAGVRDYLLYTLSLPERSLRAGSAAVAGLLRESSELLVPRAFRSSKTYSVVVRQMLDFLAEDVGGVARPESADAPPAVEQYVARKTVGNFVEMAGLATLHVSPMVLLAVVSDIAYGSQTYLRELAAELKQQGIISPDSTIDHAEDLLAAVAHAAGTTASALDTPPLTVAGLRQTIDQVRQSVSSVDPAQVLPQAEIRRLWDEIHALARHERVGAWQVSTVISLYLVDKLATVGRGGLATARVAGSLFNRHVIGHYSAALTTIRQQGFYAALARTAAPYAEAVWRNFAAGRATWTHELVSGRPLVAAWAALRSWFERRRSASPGSGVADRER